MSERAQNPHNRQYDIVTDYSRKCRNINSTQSIIICLFATTIDIDDVTCFEACKIEVIVLRSAYIFVNFVIASNVIVFACHLAR